VSRVSRVTSSSDRVRQESDESDESGHCPTYPPRWIVRRMSRTIVGRVGLCLGDRSRHTSRAARRVEYHCLHGRVAVRSRGVGGDTSSRTAATKRVQKGGVYCRTLSERRIDLSLDSCLQSKPDRVAPTLSDASWTWLILLELHSPPGQLKP